MCNINNTINNNNFSMHSHGCIAIIGSLKLTYVSPVNILLIYHRPFPGNTLFQT